MIGWQEYEGIAREALERAAQDDVVDLREVARCNGIAVLDAHRGHTRALGDAVFLRRTGEPRREKWAVAHELGHIFAARAGLDPLCEATANGIANALVIPDRAAKRDLGRYDWQVAPIRARHELSWEATLRRLVTVVSSVGALWKGGRIVWAGRSPWLRNEARFGDFAGLPRQLGADDTELVFVTPEAFEEASGVHEATA